MLAIIGLIGGLVGALIVAKNYLRHNFDEGFSDIIEKELLQIENDGY